MDGGKAAKVVIDTNILVSALWTPEGNAAKIIALLPLGKIIPCYNFPILQEYREVLQRPKLRFSGSKTAELLTIIGQYGLSIVAGPSSVIMADESDRKFYETAKTAEAVLITGNIRHYPQETFIRGEGLIPRGLPRFKGIKPESNTSREQHTSRQAARLLIVTPAEFLQMSKSGK
jgi:putative PIN family toxin of toxin-antitoxin system